MITDLTQDRIEREREHLVYRNEYLALYDDEVEFPNGRRGRYVRTVWTAPYSVAVLPIATNGDYILIRQFCYAQDKWLLQVPKGFGVDGVSPEEMARRELDEEAGLIAIRTERIGTLAVDPGFIANPLFAFRAWVNAAQHAPRLEEAELISGTVRIARDKGKDSAWLASLCDVTTQMMILFDLQFPSSNGVSA